MDSSSSLQGQPPNLQQVSESSNNCSPNCHICNKPIDSNNAIRCFKCTLHFHLLCANVDNNNQSLRWFCQNCSKQTQGVECSAASICSRSSTHSRRHALELQRLHEETQLERDFIKKKISNS